MLPPYQVRAGSAQCHSSCSRSLRNAVYQPDLAESPGVAGRCDTGPGPGYRRRSAPCHGPQRPPRLRPLVLVGDNGYAVLDLLHCCQSLAQPVTLIARLRLDAALYAPAPPRQPGQNGRPPLKGARRPSLKALLDQPQTTWASAAVAWYDGTTRTVEFTSRTAVWYRSGKPPVPIRWVLIRDPQGSFAPQSLLCTDPAADPTRILQWFVLRWQLEVTPYPVRGRLFQEVRTHLGVETQRQWSDQAIARTTPILMGIWRRTYALAIIRPSEASQSPNFGMDMAAGDSPTQPQRMCGCVHHSSEQGIRCEPRYP